MTDKDIRNEWEKHYGDILPKEEVDKAFTKVMNSADNLEKTQTKIIRTGLRHRIFRAAMTCAAAAVVLFFVPWATLKVNEKLNGQEAVLTADRQDCARSPPTTVKHVRSSCRTVQRFCSTQAL